MNKLSFTILKNNNKYLPELLFNSYILWIAFFVFNGMTVNAQKEKEDYITREITLNYPDSIIKMTILTNKVTVKTDPSIYYYWFESNDLNKNQGGYSGRLLHGIFQVYDINNHLLTQGNFKKGTKSGVWKYWNKLGNLLYMEEWSGGKLNGDYTKYNNDGSVSIKAKYRDNRLHGKMYIYLNGKVTIEKYKNGKKQEKTKKPEKTSSIEVENDSDKLKKQEDKNSKVKKEEDPGKNKNKFPKSKTENNGGNNKEEKQKEGAGKAGLFKKFNQWINPNKQNKKSK